MRHIGTRTLALALTFSLVGPAVVAAQPPPLGLDGGVEHREAGEGENGEGGDGGEQKESRQGREEPPFPAPLGRFFDAFDPSRLQQYLDTRGNIYGDNVSPKPRSPEIPLALFFESIRPLGALKYESEVNYLVAPFSGDARTLETFGFEYVFADWQAARFEAVAPGGSLEAVAFGYQRTFGVGPNGNWIHGGLVQPEFAVTGSGFVGGSALYTFAVKPERESPWTLSLSAGVNRASFETTPLEGAVEGGVGSMGRMMLGGREGEPEPAEGRERPEREGEEEARVFRPLASANLFYTLSPKLTLGLEMNAFVHHRFGEYVVLPNIFWRPTKHLFLQLGAGYYEIGGEGQAIFACRANLFNPSPRRSFEDHADD